MHFQSLERITLEDVLKYEWPPIVLSLSENVGEMRASKSKSDLKNTSSGGIYAYNQLWAISWATNDTVEDLGDAL